MLLLWTVLEDSRTSNMVKSKRTVLNLEQGEDAFLYLHEILKTIHAGVGGGTGMRLETWYETIAVG